MVVMISLQPTTHALREGMLINLWTVRVYGVNGVLFLMAYFFKKIKLLFIFFYIKLLFIFFYIKLLFDYAFTV